MVTRRELAQRAKDWQCWAGAKPPSRPCGQRRPAWQCSLIPCLSDMHVRMPSLIHAFQRALCSAPHSGKARYTSEAQAPGEQMTQAPTQSSAHTHHTVWLWPVRLRARCHGWSQNCQRSQPPMLTPCPPELVAAGPCSTPEDLYACPARSGNTTLREACEHRQLLQIQGIFIITKFSDLVRMKSSSRPSATGGDSDVLDGRLQTSP